MSNQLTTTNNTIAIGDSELIERARQVFAELDTSDNTRKEYLTRIKLFLDFIKTNGFDNNTFLAYKRYLKERTDYGISTKNKYLTAGRVFIKELHRQGVLPVDITVNVKGFTQDKKHKRSGLADKDMQTLITALNKLEPTPNNLRLKAIIALLALQGLRQVELTRLDVADIDLVRGKILVQGKGRDDKEPVYLHPMTTKALKAYLTATKKADGALFTSTSNNARGQRLNTRSIRQLVKDALNKLDIDNSTHGFRHYFTTTLIKTYKGDLLAVAKYTRHRNVEMLQVYNDDITLEADLPRYYGAFSGVKL